MADEPGFRGQRTVKFQVVFRRQVSYRFGIAHALTPDPMLMMALCMYGQVKVNGFLL